MYVISDVAKALLKVLEGQQIWILYIYDRNTPLTEWNGMEVKKSLYENLEQTTKLVLITLVARHNEMEEFLRHQGKILCLDSILKKLK